MFTHCLRLTRASLRRWNMFVFLPFFSIFITIPLLTHLTFFIRALQVVLLITKIARVFSTKKKWRFPFERLLVVCFVLTRSFRLIYYYLLCCCRVLDFLFAYHRCYHLHVLVAVLSCLFFFCVTHLSQFGCFGWITFKLFNPFVTISIWLRTGCLLFPKMNLVEFR